MSEIEKNEWVEKYESDLKIGIHSYFDADEIDEISAYYEMSDRIPAALSAIEYGLTLHPGNMDLELKHARYLLISKRVDDAERIMRAIGRCNVEANLLMAEIHYLKDRFAEAEAILHELLSMEEITEEICFDSLDIISDYDSLEEVTRYVESAISVLPDARGILRELAMVYEDAQQYNLAIAIYNRLIDLDPYSAVDWFSLAKVYALLGRYDDAIEACDFALTAREDDPTILSFKGYCYYDSGRYSDAIEQFLEFAKTDTDKAVAYELIAECYAKMNENKKAVEYLSEALTLSPDNANLCYQLATNYYDLGDLPKCGEFLKKTIALDDTDADAHAFLGELYFYDNKFAEAYRELTRALELDEEDIPSRLLLADACRMLDLPEESLAHYERVLKQEPLDPTASFSIIGAYYKVGDEEAAMRQIARLEAILGDESAIASMDEVKRSGWMQTRKMFDALKALLKDHLDNAAG